MNINGKYIKRGTIITVVSIIVLTLATMNVSYSSFFSVQTQTNVPVITAGNLSVTAEVTPKPTSPTGDGLMPSSGYTSITSSSSAISGTQNTDYIKETLKITNKSNLKVTVGVSLQNSNIENIQNASPESIVIAIQKNNNWITFGTTSTYWVQLSNLVTSSNGIYPIIKDDIGASSGTGTAVTYDIYMWVKDDAKEEDAEKDISYNISVKAIPAEGQDSSNSVPSVSSKAS